MPQAASYEQDSYLRRMDTRILESGADPQPSVVLEDTLFYPEGGGQPSDRGTINGVSVVDVRRVKGAVRHFVETSLALGPALLELDWKRRFDHMQQHTGQHLLSALALDRFGWKTTAFHLGEKVCDIEVDTSSLSVGQLDELEEMAAAEVRGARPVRVRRVSAEEFETLDVRTRGLPEGHEGPIRLVEIEGIDVNTCGGTHLSNTAELESLKLLGSESMRGGSRIYYLAGRRVRQRLGEHEARNAQLRSMLGTGDESLTETLEAKLDQLKDALRQARAMEDELAASVAAALHNSEQTVLSSHFEAKEMVFLQKVAREAVRTDQPRVIFLTASSGGRDGLFVLAANPAAGVQTSQLGPQIAELLGGRGGGAEGLFQGKCSRIDRRGEALDLVGGPLVRG